MLHNLGIFIRGDLISPVMPLSTQLLLPVLIWMLIPPLLLVGFLGLNRLKAPGGVTAAVVCAMLAGLAAYALR